MQSLYLRKFGAISLEMFQILLRAHILLLCEIGRRPESCPADPMNAVRSIYVFGLFFTVEIVLKWRDCYLEVEGMTKIRVKMLQKWRKLRFRTNRALRIVMR